MDDVVRLLVAALPALGVALTAFRVTIQMAKHRADERAEIDRLADAIQRAGKFDEKALAPGLSPKESEFAESLLQRQVASIKRVHEVKG